MRSVPSSTPPTPSRSSPTSQKGWDGWEPILPAFTLCTHPLPDSLELDNVLAALALGAVHNHDESRLLSRHLVFAFRTLSNFTALEHHLDQVTSVILHAGLYSEMNVQICGFVLNRRALPGDWFERTFAEIDGCNFSHLLLLYRTKSRDPTISASARSKLQKHITVIQLIAKKVPSEFISVDIRATSINAYLTRL